MNNQQINYFLFRKAEIAAIQSQIVYWQCVLQTEAYLDLNLQRMSGTPLKKEEKRDHVLSTIQSLVNSLRDLQEEFRRQSEEEMF